MIQLHIPNLYDNNAVHQQLKIMMQQKKVLDIRLDESNSLWVSTPKLTRMPYIISKSAWDWLIRYLRTGDYEDFGVKPMDTLPYSPDFQRTLLKELIESGCNIVRIPFIRETQAYIYLIALFKYGKLFFRIRREDNLQEYLINKEI